MGNAGSITIGAKIETKQFDKQIDYIESRLEEIEYQLKQADLGFEVGDTQKLEQEYEKLSNKLVDLRNKKQEVSETSIDDGGISTQRFGDGIEKITKKIARMGLAMIGIRSLYGMISSSVSRITEENPQLQAQIEGIRNAIDNVVAKLVDLVLPVIELIVSKVGDLLKGLFGIDISSKNFNNNMKSANKTISKIRKQLLGFDEMNILNKDGTIGGLGSSTSGGGTTPKTSTTSKKIIDLSSPGAKDFFTFGAKDWINLPSTKKFLKKGVKDFIKEKNNILTRGAGSSLWQWLFGKNKSGTIDDIESILSSTNGLSKEMASKIRDTFIGASVEYKNGMVQITTTTGQAIKMTETDYKRLMQMLGTSTDETTGKITGTWTSFVQKIANKFLGKDNNSFFGGVTTAMNDVVNASNTDSDKTKTQWTSKLLEVVKMALGKDNNSFFGGVTSAFNSVQNDSKTKSGETKNNWFNALDNVVKKATSKDKTGLVGGVLDAVNTISKTNPKVNVEPDTNGFTNSILNVAKQTTATIGNISIKKKTMGDAIANAVKGVTLAIGASNAVTGALGVKVSGYKNGGIVDIPRLASGGIINKPGKGVPLGVGGEISKEGVIPMDNQSQMQLLGREIAKYISINLTNITELDGRQIALTTAKVMNDMQFQSNGGVI